MNSLGYFLRRIASTTPVTRLKSQARVCGGGGYRTLRRHPRHTSSSLFHSSPLNRIIRLNINFSLLLFRSTLEVHYTFRAEYTTGENAKKIWLLMGTSQFPNSDYAHYQWWWGTDLTVAKPPPTTVFLNSTQHDDQYYKEQNSYRCNHINEIIYLQSLQATPSRQNTLAESQAW